MVNRQVITIGKEGSVSGLQRKPGQGLNLQTMGKAKTTRASEILWDEDEQKWYVDVLQEAGKGPVTRDKLMAVMTETQINDMVNEYRPVGGFLGLVANMDGSDPRWMTGDYDAAVKVEIAYLDALRLKGQH